MEAVRWKPEMKLCRLIEGIIYPENPAKALFWFVIGYLVVLSIGAATSAEPPLLLIVEQQTVMYGPNGQRVTIPAGAELDVCADELGVLVDYEHTPQVVRVPAPCSERPLFNDGFE
jgi:hypothetical protein